MKKYTNNEIKKIAIEKYSKDYEMFQGQINWFIKGFREALSQHDVSGRSELLPKRLSNEAYKKAKSLRYEEFVQWWDNQV